jgi:hypothetical protein
MREAVSHNQTDISNKIKRVTNSHKAETSVFHWKEKIRSPSLGFNTSRNFIHIKKAKVTLSLQQAVEAYRIVTRRGSHIF